MNRRALFPEMSILNKIESLRDEIRYHEKKYYRDCAPEITDFQFDMKMKELEKLERENPGFFDLDSPTQKPGY